MVRDGLARMLGLLPGIEVTGTAIDGADAVRQVATTDPDIVLMDLNMPTVDGVEATRRLTELGCRTGVVVLTTYADDDWVFRALQAGARGFLSKDSGAEDIRQAIITVAAGDAQLDPTVQRRLLEILAGGERVGLPSTAPAPRRADGTGGRGAHRDRAGIVQPGDRGPAVRLRGDREDTHEPPAGQDRLPGPGSAGCVRLPDGPSRLRMWTSAVGAGRRGAESPSYRWDRAANSGDAGVAAPGTAVPRAVSTTR